MENQNGFIVNDKNLIDDSKLLKHYLSEIKKTKKSYKQIHLNIKKYNDFLFDFSLNIGETIGAKADEDKLYLKNCFIELEVINKKIKNTKDIKIKEHLKKSSFWDI